MRLIKISSPEGAGESVAKIAFASGIETISVHQTTKHSADGRSKTCDVIEIEASTPKAKQFIDAFLAADFYNTEDFSFTVRAPQSIVSGESPGELTKPLYIPATDLNEELWQFSHITISFVGRIFISACLLAYGLIEHHLLLMIAGLLFLPLLPMLMAISFGTGSGSRKLVLHGTTAFLTAVVLLISGGIAVALLTHPPIKYSEFSSLPVSVLISLAVGIAAGLANIDDSGKRELIGLAATAQIAIIPVWFGICLIFGFPANVSSGEITTRALSFFINVVIIIAASFAVYVLTGTASRPSKKSEK